MRTHFSVAAVLCWALAAPLAAFAQDEDRFKDVVIETIKVGDGIYMLTGMGGNIGVSAGQDGVVLIDDQYAPLTEKVKKALAAISDRPVRFVINTHWHGDHTGGNENLGKENVIIVAHDNVRTRMSHENFSKLFDTTIPASPAAALPVITFNDTVTFHLNGATLRALYQPNAHTDGDSVLHFVEANVIHMGDLWFNGMYPFIDTESNGSIDGVIAAVERILKIANAETKIMPGHGPLGDRKALQGYLDMLKDVRARVKKLIDEGKSLEEILAAKPLADYDETLGKGFLPAERFLAIVHASLSKP